MNLETIEQFYLEAQEFYVEGDYAACIDILAIGTSLIKKGDQGILSKIQMLKADAHFNMGEYNEALNILEEALNSLKLFAYDSQGGMHDEIKDVKQDIIELQHHLLFKISLCYFKLNSYDKCISMLEHVDENQLNKKMLLTLHECYKVIDPSKAYKIGLTLLSKKLHNLRLIDWLSEYPYSSIDDILKLEPNGWLLAYIKLKFGSNENPVIKEDIQLLNKTFPDNDKIKIENLLINYRLGNYNAAIEQYKKLNSKASLNNIHLYKIMNMSGKLQMENELSFWTKRVNQNNKDSIASLLGIARMMDLECDFESSLVAIEKAIEKDPFNSDLRIANGQLLFRYKKYNMAFQEFQAAFQNQKSFMVFEGLVNSAIKLNLDIAEVYAIMATTVLGKNSKTVSLLGIVHLAKCKDKKKVESLKYCITTFDEAIQYDPHDAYPILWKAYAQRLFKDDLQSKEILSNYLKVNICSIALTDLGFNNYYIGEEAEAMNCFARAKIYNPTYQLALRGYKFMETLIEYKENNIESNTNNTIDITKLDQFNLNFMFTKNSNQNDLLNNPFKKRKFINELDHNIDYNDTNFNIAKQLNVVPKLSFTPEEFSPVLFNLC